MKRIYCKGCGIKVAEIANGSKLKKGMVCLCDKCDTKRVSSDWADKTRPKNGVPGFDNFMDNFGGIFK